MKHATIEDARDALVDCSYAMLSARHWIATGQYAMALQRMQDVIGTLEGMMLVIEAAERTTTTEISE